MKTLQRQNTKREIVKKVRFSKNLAADADASKKYIQKPNNSINGASKVKGIIKEIKDTPAATEAHSSLETTSILPDTNAAAGAHTGAHTNEDVSGPAANSNQHENAITLSLTE
jgi:hypothetical protein